jgi:hypothetical protein
MKNQRTCENSTDRSPADVQVQVGPGQWISLREMMQSSSSPDDPVYRKVLEGMIDPRQTGDVQLRRYFWEVALRHRDEGLARFLAEVAVAGGETDPVILGALAPWWGGSGSPPFPPCSSGTASRDISHGTGAVTDTRRPELPSRLRPSSGPGGLGL